MNAQISQLFERYLGEQTYPYQWEIGLFSMNEKDSALKFRNFLQNGALEHPVAAITLNSQTEMIKSDREIIQYISSIQAEDACVCIVVAHVHYNPADLQALYILDCEPGKEEECFHQIKSHWNSCSELYFFKMEASHIINDMEKRLEVQKEAGSLIDLFINWIKSFK